MGPSKASISAALEPFGWTCGPEFWQRYHSDPWVFNLANAVDRLTEQVAEKRAHDEPELAEPARETTACNRCGGSGVIFMPSCMGSPNEPCPKCQPSPPTWWDMFRVKAVPGGDTVGEGER